MGEMENFWKILNFYFQQGILDVKIIHANRQRQNSPSFSYCLNYSKKGAEQTLQCHTIKAVKEFSLIL